MDHFALNKLIRRLMDKIRLGLLIFSIEAEFFDQSIEFKKIKLKLI